MNVAALLTGNELMTGDTVDSNSSMMAKKLSIAGFNLAYKVTVGDDLDLLVAEMRRLSKQYSLVIVNGGLGPTVDDLTAQALAMVVDRPLEKNEQALDDLTAWCEKKKIELNSSNLKQCYLPEGAFVLHNPVGSAAGFGVHINDSVILCTPGVPSELSAMLDESIVRFLQDQFPHAQAKSIRRLKFFGIGESRLQQKLSKLKDEWPSSVGLGFRAGLPLLEVKLEIDDQQYLDDRHHAETLLRQTVGEYIVGENDDSLASLVYALLKKQNKTLALAESCTGGAIAAQLTAISGISEVFEAGIVSYSNAVKHKVLDVDKAILDTKGAVSEEVVVEMAQGALSIAEADYVIAVSGIAGPSGGTTDKPVGTVWLAWGEKNDLRRHQFNYPVSRKLFQRMIAALALDLLRRFLLKEDGWPNYFQK